ncbi:spore germination protein GerPE [Cytobacillus solani]|uniref:spore germination protein GerPE n=1 Tax=Cytobacillus solani TaxID=1637975 RepID=UPI0020796BBD|nr:spore germination protein GerPE [Cytobacillus solani]USK56606.1 spore germination protein GerPE [Cytobacillus solani]
MLQRTSVVNYLKVETLSFSSILEIGDSTYTQGFSRAIAIQREAEAFFGYEADFKSYSTFTDPIPIPPITETISINTLQLNPIIKVQKIDVIGVSSSSILQIGNAKHISMESRVDHIRHLLSNHSDDK